MKILVTILAILVVILIFVGVGLLINLFQQRDYYEDREEDYKSIISTKEEARRSARKDYEDVKRDYETVRKDYEETKTEYTAYTEAVEAKEAEKKEIAKRRRITQKDRNYVLTRDNYTCQICGISKQFVDNLCEGLGDYLLFEIDHIDSIANGADSNTDNLQTLCWRCNRKKGGKKTNAEVVTIITYGIRILMANLKEAVDKSDNV